MRLHVRNAGTLIINVYVLSCAQDGDTPMTLAIQHRNPALLEPLQIRGADVNKAGKVSFPTSHMHSTHMHAHTLIQTRMHARAHTHT